MLMPCIRIEYSFFSDYQCEKHSIHQYQIIWLFRSELSLKIITNRSVYLFRHFIRQSCFLDNILLQNMRVMHVSVGRTFQSSVTQPSPCVDRKKYILDTYMPIFDDQR
jgi:hypothetical protein